MGVHFGRKLAAIEDLKEIIERGKGCNFTIEETVELEPAEYKAFSENLLDDYEFIVQRKASMWIDGDEVLHCLLVKAKGAKEGILVESEGYDYARYAAYFAEEGFITDLVMAQIQTIRSQGKVNMLDTVGIQREAYYKDFHELAFFIEDHKKEYAEFITTGQR